MMLWKRIAAAFVVVLLAAPLSVQAADFTCSVPDANVVKISAICETLRRELQVRKSAWTDNVCAGYILRIGLLAQETKRVTLQVKTAKRATIRDAVNSFTETWPTPTAVSCGDGIVDREFNESCDDGNTANGDGCDALCSIEG